MVAASFVAAAWSLVGALVVPARGFVVGPRQHRGLSRRVAVSVVLPKDDYGTATLVPADGRLERLALLCERDAALAVCDAALTRLREAETTVVRVAAEREALAASLEASEKTVDELRAIVDRHGLDVSKAIGGRRKRTKVQFRDAIVRELRVPMRDFVECVRSLKVGDDSGFREVRKSVRADLQKIVSYVVEWLPSEKDARTVLCDELDALDREDGASSEE